jgi:hypothetical protein
MALLSNALLNPEDLRQLAIPTPFGGIRFFSDPNVPKGVAYLIPDRPFRIQQAMKIDMRPAWQRGPHPRPQTDDMRKMLDDLR